MLFSDCVDGENLVCTCPITSNRSNLKKNPQDYCQVPYLILRDKKWGLVRVSDLAFWKEETVHSAGLNVALRDLKKIYTAVSNYVPSHRVDEFELAQSYISEVNLDAQINDELRKGIEQRKAITKVKRRKAGGGVMVYE